MSLLSARRVALVTGPAGPPGPQGPPGPPGAGGSTATGTGFVHVTAGATDPAASLVNLATDVTGVLSSANGGYAWKTLLDFDFTTPATQALATDGNYTIGGLTWTKANSANDGTPMAVTHGTGLVVIPGFTAGGYGASLTAPLLRLPFSQIAGTSGLAWSTRFRLYLAMTIVSDLTGEDQGFAGIDSGSTGLVISVGMGAYFGGTPGIRAQQSYNGVTPAGDSGIATTLSAGTCAVLELDRLNGGAFASYGGAISGGSWPALGACLPKETIVNTAVNDFSQVGALASLGLSVGATNGGGSPTVTITRIRLDALGN